MRLMLDEMHRLLVPKGLRDRFALKPGDELEVTFEADGIRLRPVTPRTSLIEKDGILVCASALPEEGLEIDDFIEEQRQQRIRDIGGL